MRSLALLALLLAAPAAFAHPGHEFDVISAESGGVVVYLTPQTPVVKSGREVLFQAEVFAMDGGYTAIPNGTFTLDAIGPGNASIELASASKGFTARVNFSRPGGWRLDVGANGAHVEIPLDVYPTSEIRIESTELRYDIFHAGAPMAAGLAFVDDASGAPVDRDATATGRIERWVNETKVGEDVVVPLSQGSTPGEFLFEHVFREEGSHRLRIASPEHGVGFDGLPPFRLNIRPALGTDERETPGAGAPALLLALSLLAIARWRR